MSKSFEDNVEKQFVYERNTPENALDFNMQMLDSLWGKKGKINEDLQKKLTQAKYYKDIESGKLMVDKDDLWAVLGNYTRDLRLGNLDKVELGICWHYLNFASDCLKGSFVNSFIVSMSRVATILELSQSKYGFLRRRPNTLETSKTEQTLEPKRKGFFGRQN